MTEADLLIHVVDSSSPYFEKQIKSVYHVLAELGSEAKPILTVFNKEDKIERPLTEAMEKYQPSVSLSARNRTGLDTLLLKLDALLPAPPASIPPSEF